MSPVNLILKEPPSLYENKEDCCGCSACYAICPRNAITMKEDGEGFEYPLIDEKRCIRCNQCINICPIKRMDNDARNIGVRPH